MAFVGAGGSPSAWLLAVGDGSGQALNQTELALFDGLRSHSWIDGRNLIIEYRFSQPPDRLPASVADLIALSPDVLIVPGPRAAVALKSATATIPIVFEAVGDPVGLGLVQSLSRPGGNITGLATIVPEDFLGKRIEILRELVPGASKITILVNPGNPMHKCCQRHGARPATVFSLMIDGSASQKWNECRLGALDQWGSPAAHGDPNGLSVPHIEAVSF